MTAFRFANRMSPPEKESDIQKSILKYLQMNRIFAFSVKTQGTYDPKRKAFRLNPQMTTGVSDIIGSFNGRLLAIEVKTRRGKTTKNQDEFIRKVNEAGGVGFVARSIDDVEKMLGEA